MLKRFLFVILLCTAGSASAQWSITAPKLLGNISATSDYGGAICYRDGNLWVGWRSLFLSQDQGLTFRQIPLPITIEFILDISFFDRNTGIVVTSGSVFLTQDAGATWLPVLTLQGFFSADFMGSAKDIIVAGAGPVYTSRDGGATWSTHNLPGAPIQSIARRGSVPIPGTAYVMTENGNRVFINTTTDYGGSWTQAASSTFQDSYSFAPDSCDQNSFYLANEAAYATLATQSIIWYTHNAGQSWQQGLAHPRQYFEGAIATGLLAVFAPSIHNGIWCSVDHGSTWKNIGGPTMRADNRSISAITDNLIVAVDSSGSIWRTTNAGGDSIDIRSVRSAFAFTPAVLFDRDALVSCDTSITRTAVLTGFDCMMPALLSDTIVGLNAGYAIVHAPSGSLTGNDSFTVSFTTRSAVNYFDTLVVTLDNGSVIRLPLLGTSKPPKESITSSVTTLFDRDTLNLCDSLVFRSFTLHETGCVHRRVLAENIIGGGLHYEVTADLPSQLTGGYDSIELSFTASQPGYYPATLEIILDDSTIVTIPLEGNAGAIKRSVSYSPTILFATDTLSMCDSAAVGIVVIVSRPGKRSCDPFQVLSQTISGADSTQYHLLRGAPSILSGLDTCEIAFSPTAPSSSNATLTIVLDDSEKLVVSLRGTAVIGPTRLSISPDTLFRKDTLSACGAMSISTIHITDSSCTTHKILAENIIGADSLSYDLLDSGNSNLGTSPDSIRLRFVGDEARDYHATLVLTLDSGIIETIPLEGTVKQSRSAAYFSPQSLFDGDTVWTCGPAVVRVVIIHDTSCLQRKIVSQSIVGPNAVSYTLVKEFLPVIGAADTTLIAFQPSGDSSQRGYDSVRFDDGTFVKIALGGEGMRPVGVLLVPQTLEADTVGATVSIPIVLRLSNGFFVSIPRIQFVVRYDTAMFVYRSTVFGSAELVGDVSSVGEVGSRLVRQPPGATTLDSVIGYVNLDVFPTKVPCGRVSFDSIQFVDSMGVCAAIESPSVASTVCSAIACGTSTLSNFLRYSTLTTIGLRPSPAGDHIELTSTETLGPSRISFLDPLGIAQNVENINILAGQPLFLTTPVRSGVYIVRIESAGGVFQTRAVVIR